MTSFSELLKSGRKKGVTQIIHVQFLFTCISTW